MLSALARVMCCMFLFLSAFPNAASAQGTRGGTAKAERAPTLEQKQLQAEHQQLLAQQQRLEVQERQLEQQQEQVKVLNQLKDQQQQLVTALKELAKSSSDGSTFLKLLPSLITAVVAIFVGLLALDFNQWSTRRTARQDHIRMLMDVDSRMIERPWLWSVYGNHLTPEAGEEEKLKQLMDSTKNYRQLQEDALLYSFFNMFEAVHDFHQHLGFDDSKNVYRRRLLDFFPPKPAQRKADVEYKNAWDSFARDFFSDKGGRRAWQVFDREKHLYSASFQEWVKTIHEKANAGGKGSAAPSSDPAGGRGERT